MNWNLNKCIAGHHLSINFPVHNTKGFLSCCEWSLIFLYNIDSQPPHRNSCMPSSFCYASGPVNSLPFTRVEPRPTIYRRPWQCMSLISSFVYGYVLYFLFTCLSSFVYEYVHYLLFTCLRYVWPPKDRIWFPSEVIHLHFCTCFPQKKIIPLSMLYTVDYKFKSN